MAPDSEPEDSLENPRGDDAGGDDEVPPMLPLRGVYLLAFFSVVIVGILGGIIGFGIADVGSDSAAARFVGTLLGAIIAAGGVAIVAVLVLRAMAEWRRTQ